ncbi:MEDS domain-containing protein [Lentzea sp. NPDC042327]|uniref:MEDS domain-containing protein n=1 Tax=Lentzea sp. NPDC042327 TaxID=3154801 RepID=UPI0033CC8706
MLRVGSGAMRTSGVTDVVVGMSTSDHLCWSFDDFTDFRARAAEFLVDGLVRGQRACYVARGDARELAGHLASSPVLAAALRDGSAEVIPLESRYRSGATVSPNDQVAAYAEATSAALADGFTGLRVAADATALVSSPASLDAFCRYEHLIDRYMTGSPFSAMCAYHRPELADGTVEQLASMHPVSNARGAPFRLHATADGLALVGEIDRASRELLPLALLRAEPPVDRSELRVDATGLRFIDHHGLLALHDCARSHAATLVLRSEKSALARLVSILGLEDVECVR